MYFIIFLFILTLSIYEVVCRKEVKKVFVFSFISISLISAFRYGVGSDYFSYMYIYNNMPYITDAAFSSTQLHGEIGFKILQGLSKMINLNYEAFVFIITMIIMSLFLLYIIKNSRSHLFSLFIFYTMYLFTYVNSGLRQGLTIGLFLAILLPILQRRKYIYYFGLTLLFSTLHTSILIVLVLPLVDLMLKHINIKISLKTIILIFFICILFSFVNLGILIKPFPSIYVKYNTYFSSGVSLLAILSRLTSALIISLLYFNVKEKVNVEEKRLLVFYFVGLLLYIVFSGSPLISSRLHVYFKCFEIILIPNFIYLVTKSRKWIGIISITFIFLTGMWIKEIDAALEQGEYYKRNIITYPYTHIFNKEEIKKHRIIRDYGI